MRAPTLACVQNQVWPDANHACRACCAIICTGWQFGNRPPPTYTCACAGGSHGQDHLRRRMITELIETGGSLCARKSRLTCVLFRADRLDKAPRSFKSLSGARGRGSQLFRLPWGRTRGMCTVFWRPEPLVAPATSQPPLLGLLASQRHPITPKGRVTISAEDCLALSSCRWM